MTSTSHRCLLAALVLAAAAAGCPDETPAVGDDGGAAAAEDAGGTALDDAGVVDVADDDGGFVAVDGGFVAIDGGFIALDGGFIALDGGQIALDGGFVVDEDGGLVAVDGGFVQADGGFEQQDGGFAQQDGGFAQQDGGFVSVDGGPAPTSDDLAVASGCAGVFNPDQVLTYELTMSAGDWSALKADATNDVYFQATMSCAGGASMVVGVRRKRSGGTDKPGLKVDVNEFVNNEWYGLHKLSFENGISEGSGSGSTTDVVAEYLGWRLMQLSGTIASRAAFAKIVVNGADVGTYTNVEQADKVFLRSRLGEDEGWLYKKSGSADDGYKTNETVVNPYESDACFMHDDACPIPADDQVAAHVDAMQLVKMGAINALIGNMDAPLWKDNNYIWYDGPTGGPRKYFPWDLDTVMNRTEPLFGGSAPGGTTRYVDALFPAWEDDYDQFLTNALAGPISLAAIEAELANVGSIAAAALDADPTLDGATADAIDDLEAWWTDRIAAAQSELAAH